MRTNGVTCPKCRHPARRMYRRWDELTAHGLAFTLGMLIAAGLLAGLWGHTWGYLSAAAVTLALAALIRRTPKKYYCDGCTHAFLRRPVRARPQPSAAAHEPAS